MIKIKKRHIFFVDDDAGVRKAVGETLKENGFTVTCFAGAADCLEQLGNLKCDLLITDVKMPEMDGIELLTEVKSRAPWLPVLLVTGCGDIPMAAKAFKRGTDDFIEKPLSRDVLLSVVESTLRRSGLSPDSLLGKTLTAAEMRIFRLILDSKSNKEIAYLLKRSVRTVEVHRSRIMRKLGVNSVVDLIKRAAQMGLV